MSHVGRRVASWARQRWSLLAPLHADALLYGCSAVFAVGLWRVSATIAESHWGSFAAPGYAVGCVLALVAQPLLRPQAHQRGRIAIAVVVGLLALVGPLLVLAQQRHNVPAGNYAQPEVMVVERAAEFVWHGHSPYQAYWNGSTLVGEVAGVPSYESFFPYLPLMTVFGLPAAVTNHASVVGDARILMTLTTLTCLAGGLWLLRLRVDRALRVAHWLVVLPTGAMFLATGGDDLPIVGLLFVGLALSMRHRVGATALALALAAALKFTAWPFVLGGALVTRDRDGRLRWLLVIATSAVVVAGTVLPFFLAHPNVFVANVLLFPSGLAHVASPAASPFPGHVLTTLWAPLGKALQVFVAVGVVGLALRIRRHWPLSTGSMLRYVALVSALVIASASATRFGYIIYPLNFWVWSYAIDGFDRRQIAAEF